MFSELYAACADELTDGSLYRKVYGGLSVQKKEKVDAMPLTADRRRCAGAEALLFYALHRHGCAYGEKLAVTDTGKPYLPAHPAWHFNLSHAGSWIVCAVSSFEIGCDIERIREKTPTGIARYFSEEEQRLLNAAPHETARRELFFRLWTLRESYVKATGEGLSFPLAPVPFRLREGTPVPTAEDSPYSFFEYGDFKGYACSVCVRDRQRSAPPPLVITDFKTVAGARSAFVK